LLYRLVRHPLMAGFLVAFWAAPTMTVGHLLFAAGTTGYILVALQLEERDLVASLGDRYRVYQGSVPMLVPGVRPRQSSCPVHQHGASSARAHSPK
ncbi:MAG TPA: isoprenylcysteine carboxylmethyltransferase family protein, partial [Mycobacterium sp.]|nr:isoprenylcysteine carboxylmethyltransferase family protein [Mycobacterium sp.]